MQFEVEIAIIKNENETIFKVHCIAHLKVLQKRSKHKQQQRCFVGGYVY